MPFTEMLERLDALQRRGREILSAGTDKDGKASGCPDPDARRADRGPSLEGSRKDPVRGRRAAALQNRKDRG